MTIYHHPEPNPDLSVPDPHQDPYSKTILGFWIGLMTDCLLFGTLFAVYAVLHTSTFGGPGPKDLFSLPEAFIETMLLLFSSVTCGFAVLSKKRNYILAWLAITFLLGAGFLTMELREFWHLIHEGHDWTKSAFLSSFFTLVSTHGLHITVGLLWIIVLFLQLLYYGISALTFRRLVVFSMFWHFLDLIWIFIFTIVYLLGVA
jgi:cytochrome o ubiquinol oxidase subunit 3